MQHIQVAKKVVYLLVMAYCTAYITGCTRFTTIEKMDGPSRIDFLRGGSDARLIRGFYHKNAGSSTKRQIAEIMQAKPYCINNFLEPICYANLAELSATQISYLNAAADDELLKIFNEWSTHIHTKKIVAQILHKRSICDAGSIMPICAVYKKASETSMIARKTKVIKKQAIVNKENQLKWAKSVISKPVSKFSNFFPKDINYEKGRYETTNEYQLRKKASWAQELMYFDISSQLQDLEYNADSTTLTVFHSTQKDRYGRRREPEKFSDSSFTRQPHIKSRLIGLSDLFVVNTSVTDLGSHMGENAYGAKREVSKTYMERDIIYFSNLGYFTSRTNIKIIVEPYRISSVSILRAGFKHYLSIPRTQIKSVEKNLRLRIVVKKPNSILDYAQSSAASTATIDEPSELTSKSNYIRSELVGMVLYNQRTKKIYATYQL